MRTLPTKSIFSIALFSLFGFVLSVTQFFGISPDYPNYVLFFDLLRYEKFDIFVESRFEPGFSLIALALQSFLESDVAVYSSIVASALLVKGWVLRLWGVRGISFFVLSAYYFVVFFPLHELTQLRAACAIALVMTGAVQIWSGRIGIGLFICGTSLLFHISAAGVIPALFLFFDKRWQVILCGFAVFVITSAFAAAFTGTLGIYFQTVGLYQATGFGNDPNPVSVELLIQWAMVVTSLLFWQHLTDAMRRIILLEIVGLAIFYGAIEYAVIAHRIREFYSVFWVFFLGAGLRNRGTRQLSVGFIAGSIIFYYYNIFVIEAYFK